MSRFIVIMLGATLIGAALVSALSDSNFLTAVMLGVMGLGAVAYYFFNRS
jgi:hypothetical protein